MTSDLGYTKFVSVPECKKGFKRLNFLCATLSAEVRSIDYPAI